MRLDVAGVVVAFHLEDDGLPVADIDHAGVLAGAADHLRAGGRQLLQVDLRRLVGTMLVPHRRKDAQFGERGLSAQDVQQPLPFIRLDPVRGDQFGGDCGFRHGILRLAGICARPRRKPGQGKGRRARARAKFSRKWGGWEPAPAAAPRKTAAGGKKKAEQKLGPSPTGRYEGG
jgi:hypothetical protein